MATAAVPSSNLLNSVRCDLCLEKYNDSNRLPKLLNCSHTFCLACVQRYHESKLKMSLACPNCREIFTVPPGGVQKLKTNIMVFSLLDYLAPFTAVDTYDGITEEIAVPKYKMPEEPGSSICGLHPKEKREFYRDDIRDPMCHDYKIQKLKDVLTTYSTQHKDAIQLVTRMSIEGKQRTEALLKELVLSRDSLIKKAKSRRYQAHQEADRWYHNTTGTISKVYEELHAQILQFMSKIDLQELQQSLEKIDLQKIDGDLKQAQSFLDQLQSSVTSLKNSTVWPGQLWSVNVGKITYEFTVDLGRITKPTLKLPDVNSFAYTIEMMLENIKAAQPNVAKQSGKQSGCRLLSDLPMQPGCHSSVGLTTNEAVVRFEDRSSLKNLKIQSIIQKITFKDNQITVLKQCPMDHEVGESWNKYILNNSNVLLRKSSEGPTNILNSQLELVSTIQEDYGEIVGAESTHWVAFYEYGTIKIYDLDQKQLLQTLRPPAGAEWLSSTHICRHPDSQAIAVLSWDRNLCIHDRDGRLLHTHKVQFQSYIIACNRRHLYVVSQFPVSVSVLLWSGQLVTTLNTQQLGIPLGYSGYIQNIAVDEDQFTIAVGHQSVSSFKTFQCV